MIAAGELIVMDVVTLPRSISIVTDCVVLPPQPSLLPTEKLPRPPCLVDGLHLLEKIGLLRLVEIVGIEPETNAELAELAVRALDGRIAGTGEIARLLNRSPAAISQAVRRWRLKNQ